MVMDGIRTEVKRCKICGKLKKAEEFYTGKHNTKYGVKLYLVSNCKDCMGKYDFRNTKSK